MAITVTDCGMSPNPTHIKNKLDQNRRQRTTSLEGGRSRPNPSTGMVTVVSCVLVACCLNGTSPTIDSFNLMREERVLPSLSAVQGPAAGDTAGLKCSS